jgi:RimJ/RimL family protein N-acetyltransferase
MIHQDVPFQGEVIRLRDIEEKDIPALVSYWADSSPEYIRSIGADPRKVPSRDQLAAGYRSALPQNGPGRTRLVLIGESPTGHLIGYTNLSIKSADESYAHVHILDPAYRARGVGQAMFPHVLRQFFLLMPIRKIMMQTSPENNRVNRFLQAVGLTPEHVHLAEPDGMARPGEFYVYTLARRLFIPEQRPEQGPEQGPEQKPDHKPDHKPDPAGVEK